jgi:adenosylhomocysteine nucleosidase
MSACHKFARGPDTEDLRFAVLVSADAEWRVVKPSFATETIKMSPYGEYLFTNIGTENVLFFQGGWGKIAAAGSTQYVIDHFHPARLINIGTCGGVEGRVKCFDVVVIEKAIVYDIEEAMSDPKQAIAAYSTSLSLPARLPIPAVKATMYSADRDLTAAGLRQLDAQQQLVVADWESGAIAWVAHRNATPVLILRGVTDLVNADNSDAQSSLQSFHNNTEHVIQNLLGDLPKWLAEWR